MKSSKLRVWIVLTLPLLVLAGAATVVSTGCSSKSHEKKEAHVTKWQCPMHPTVIKDEPGDCPICNMKLVPMEATTTPAPKTASKGERKVLFYRSPMDPKQTSPTPRKDEMGMDFVPVYADEAEAGADTGIPGFAAVVLDARKQQLLGVKTAEVKRGPLSTSIRTVGRVAYDERRVHHVHTRFEAYVEHIEADFTGKFVRKGEELAQLYSPELYATSTTTPRGVRSRSASLVARDLSFDTAKHVAGAIARSRVFGATTGTTWSREVITARRRSSPVPVTTTWASRSSTPFT